MHNDFSAKAPGIDWKRAKRLSMIGNTDSVLISSQKRR